MASSKGVGAIIVAAGRGVRMGSTSGVKKQFREVGGKSLLEWSVARFDAASSVDAIVVVTGSQELAWVQERLQRTAKVVAVVPGGDSRQASVAQGLAALPPDTGWVVVHDGARPLVSVELIERVVQAVKRSGAAIAALPAAETIKEATRDEEDDGRIVVSTTLERSRLWTAQTPQAFAKEILETAHARAPEGVATDDAALVEALGQPVYIVEGDPQNIKVTYESDLDLVRLRLAPWELPGVAAVQPPAQTQPTATEVVTGFGLDVHRLVMGRPLILGGVRLEHTHGLMGHSDADVLAHAVTDALLGAAGLGDIGTHFPDTDPTYKGADSIELLRVASQRLKEAGCEVVHVDAFVSAEAPKLKPHIPQMRARLAEAMGIESARVSVKAGTGEGAGPVGRREVIEARAVATVRRRF